MRFTEIGQQLRAFRLESGLRADEIAARLGVSRAALYRYEKGDVVKLDTIKRMAELLKVSPLSLLGIGVEYYHRPIGYFERLRQVEESADQILQIGDPLAYLVTTDSFDAALAAAVLEAAERAGAEGAVLRAQAEQVLGVLADRKRTFAQRRPTVICLLSLPRLRQLLETGVVTAVSLGERTRRLCRQTALAEVLHIAGLMEAEPIGLQFGLLPIAEPSGNFVILRARDRATLASNPFRADAMLGPATGVAMVTAADEAIAAHQRVAEGLWREAVKGAAAAARLRELVAKVQV
jgi:transcriptional regulator with XRE-family HTH domain